jgi:hypothetical protein
MASRSGLIYSGLVIMGLGIVVTAVSYSAASSGSGGGQYVVAYGAIFVGLFRIVRGLAAPREDAAIPEHDHGGRDERAGPARDEGPQIAGTTCAFCDKKILSVMDGFACATCAAPVHNECGPKHRKKEHPVRPAASPPAA